VLLFALDKMAERNTHYFVLALILSALVHMVVIFYGAEEESNVINNVESSVVVNIELVAGQVKPVVDTSRSEVVTEIKKQTAAKNKELVSVITEVYQSSSEEKQPEKKLTESVSNEGAAKHSNLAESSSDREDEFLKLVYVEINKKKYYPYQARRQHREGRVKINFKLHPDGRVSEVVVLQSSHFNVLDHAAQKAVESISPFLMAASYLHVETEFNVDIDYQLN